MSACTGCGDCCKTVPITLPAAPPDDDKALWFGLRGWDVGYLPDGRLEVIARTPCKCFDESAPEGARCRIYERRPKFCRNYLCPEAKEATA
jgi:Fe-S-cluster containining protein